MSLTGLIFTDEKLIMRTKSLKEKTKLSRLVLQYAYSCKTDFAVKIFGKRKCGTWDKIARELARSRSPGPPERRVLNEH